MISSIMRLLIKNKIRKKENSQNRDSLWLSNLDKGDLYFLGHGRKISERSGRLAGEDALLSGPLLS